MSKELRGLLVSTLALFFLVSGVLLAGVINTPAGDPAPTSYTLEDIYNKITDPGYSYTAHDLLATVSSDQESLYSLDTVYNTIPTYRTLTNSTSTLPAGIYGTTNLSDIELNLLPENIATGTEMFGVIGTLECTP